MQGVQYMYYRIDCSTIGTINQYRYYSTTTSITVPNALSTALGAPFAGAFDALIGSGTRPDPGQRAQSPGRAASTVLLYR